MKYQLRHFIEYSHAIGKIWINNAFFWLDVFGLTILLFKYPETIPINLLLIILLLLFIWANYLVFFQQKETIIFLNRESFLQNIENSILSELRDLAPKIGFSSRQELSQIIFDIDVYWENSESKLNSERIGHIYLINSYEKPQLEFRENKYLKVNESGYTIFDLLNHLKTKEKLAKLIITEKHNI